VGGATRLVLVLAVSSLSSVAVDVVWLHLHSPAPLPHPPHRDVLAMTRYALTLPLFREVVATQSYAATTLPGSLTQRPLRWTNTNQLLRTRIRGAKCVGVKTVRPV
jgi:hypothetical protein